MTRPSHRILRANFLLLVLFLCQAGAAAQSGGGVDIIGTGGKHTIQGRVYLPSGRPASTRLRVNLESTGNATISVLADMNGAFRFTSLQAGSYTVIIEGDDFETARESLYIDQQRSRVVRDTAVRVFNLVIHLRPKTQTSRNSAPGVLSAALASVPKPAVALYQKAQEHARRGDNKRAVEDLRAALAVHPNFALALSELGVLHMKLKEPDKAADALSAALKLAPDDYAALLTYGRALFDLQKYPESETQFRKALDRNAASPSAHFYVGMILLRRQELDGAEKSLGEAIKHGGGEMALAHYFLGGIYWGRKDYKRAAEELETYLRLAPEAENAGRVRATIRELRAKI